MRTTFRRQVTLIVSLLLAATILLGVSFWGLFTHYVIRERESSLRGTAQSSCGSRRRAPSRTT